MPSHKWRTCTVLSGAPEGCCYCCSRLNMDRVPGLPWSAAFRSCSCCYRSRSIEIGINILYNESNISCWPDFMRFCFCVDPISRDFVLCWPDFTMLIRFDEISFLCWPDFTRFRFCVDQISRDFVFVLTRFHDVDQISRDIFSSPQKFWFLL